MFGRSLCILTNFRDKNQNIPISTIEGLNNLYQSMVSYGCNEIIVLGAYFDPLLNYDWNQYIQNWYRKLFSISEINDFPVIIDTERKMCSITEDFKFYNICIDYDYSGYDYLWYIENKVYKNVYKNIGGI